MKINMPEPVAYALAVLKNNGFEAFIVGGCVRDSIMNKEPYDYDITTNATPQQVISSFSGETVIETGLKHGTVTVLINKTPIEVTTYRVDGIYSDNRRPDSVEFTLCLKDDLSRRDFTVNALAYNDEAGIIDCFNGLSDLENELIRCVGDPDSRFKEDALRLLRALRFSSVLDFDIEENTKNSIHSNRELLVNIAKERINTELSRLLCGARVESIILEYSDVLGIFIPDLISMKGFEQRNINHIHDVLTHTAKVVANTPAQPVLRLCALFHDIGKPKCFTVDSKGMGHFYGHPEKSSEMTRKALNDLRFDKETIDRVCTLVMYHDIKLPQSEKAMKHMLHKISEPVMRDLLSVKRADILAQNPAFIRRLDELNKAEAIIDKIASKNQCYTLNDLEVNGKDLINIGITNGKDIGNVLNHLLNAVIDGNTVNNKDDLLSAALRYMKTL